MSRLFSVQPRVYCGNIDISAREMDNFNEPKHRNLRIWFEEYMDSLEMERALTPPPPKKITLDKTNVKYIYE